MNAQSRLGYLPHVDGLRAVAVVPVVLFHLDHRFAPGGFVGVDIFFVISGFLITSIILDELQAGRFTLGGFYMRRVRRILPALFATIAASLVAGVVLFTPERLAALGASSAAAAASGSNLLFWLSAGYFDPASTSKPLLHTWSLSVEEQFYLVWPALLMLASRSRAALVATMAAVGVASLIGAHVATAEWPVAAFYLTPFRMFEFVLGAACIALRSRPVPTPLAAVATLMGAALIGYALVAYTAETAFPGVHALVPCLGASLLIGFADRSGVLRWGLENPACVYVGKVSYALYLAHWPILVFFWFVVFTEPSAGETAAVVVLIAAATLALHYFVEQPFRRRVFVGRSAPLAWSALAAGLAVSVLGLAIWRGEGWIWRFSPQTQALLDYRVPRESWRPYPQCYINRSGSADQFDRAFCTARDPDKINVLLVGDSHSARMRAGLEAAFPEIHLMQAGSASCRAVRGFRHARRTSCGGLNEIVFDEVIPAGGMDYVALSSNWGAEQVEGVGQTLDYLAQFDTPVVLFGPVPTFSQRLPEVIFRGRTTPDVARYADSFLNPDRFGVNTALRRVAEERGVAYLDFVELLCGASGPCRPLTANGAPLLVDEGHLTPDASIEIMTEARDRGLLAFPSRTEGARSSAVSGR